MEAREEFTRLMVWLVQQVDEVDSKQLKADIALLLGAAGQLTTVLADRNTALAKQHRSRKAKPPKPSPAKGPKKGNGAVSSTDKADIETGTEDRSKQLSAIQQGICRPCSTITRATSLHGSSAPPCEPRTSLTRSIWRWQPQAATTPTCCTGPACSAIMAPATSLANWPNTSRPTR